MARNDDFQDRYFDSLEREFEGFKSDLKSYSKRLRNVEEKAHVHNGDTKPSELPKVFKDKELLKVVLIFLTVVIVGIIMLFTGTNPLGAFI